MISFSGFPCAFFVLYLFSRLHVSTHRDGYRSGHSHDLWGLPDPWVCKGGDQMVTVGSKDSAVHKDTEIGVSENFFVTNYYKATINKNK